MRKIGKCRLCLNDPVELCSSHFFPAAAYKIMRLEAIHTGWRKNPNPVMMTDVSAVQKSQQYAAHLLCHHCEQKFSENGEKWVLRHCWRGRTFALSSLVTNAKPDFVSPVANLHRTAGISGINVSALTYFAASMFWRASIHDWSGRRTAPANLELGPYQEELRRYLLGDAEFPKNCILVVILPDRISESTKFMMYPISPDVRGFRVYKLLFLGIWFDLYVGRQIPEDLREADFVRGTGNPIIVTANFEEWFRRDLSTLFGHRERALSMLNKIEPH